MKTGCPPIASTKSQLFLNISGKFLYFMISSSNYGLYLHVPNVTSCTTRTPTSWIRWCLRSISNYFSFLRSVTGWYKMRSLQLSAADFLAISYTTVDVFQEETFFMKYIRMKPGFVPIVIQVIRWVQEELYLELIYSTVFV